MDFNSVKVPTHISPCPITEAIVELRFESNLPGDVIPGIIYPNFKSRYPKLERLPILELPSLIRENDSKFKFSPHYKYENEDFIFQIGPKSFTVICPKEYKGWSAFSPEIFSIHTDLNKLGIIEKPTRIGLRYINFFENLNIFEKIKLELRLASQPFLENKNILRTEYRVNSFDHIIQITNVASTVDKNERKTGSSMDIDIVFQNEPFSTEDFQRIVEEAHQIEKKIFFGIIEDSFLETFNPSY